MVTWGQSLVPSPRGAGLEKPQKQGRGVVQTARVELLKTMEEAGGGAREEGGANKEGGAMKGEG